MKTLIYNVNPIFCFELRRLGLKFDYLVEEKTSPWNYNIRPKPDNIEEVVEVDPTLYKNVISENFDGFNYDIPRIQIDLKKEIYLSPSHYSYVNKASKSLVSGGNHSFKTDEDAKLFVKIATKQNVEFIGTNLQMCKSVILPNVQELSTHTTLQSASINRYYKFLDTLGGYLGYVNVIRDVNYNVYEAMLLGLPVVSVKLEGDLFQHKKTGFFSDDAYELRSYITYLLTKPDVALKMGAVARNEALKKFSGEDFHRKWFGALR